MEVRERVSLPLGVQVCIRLIQQQKGLMEQIHGTIKSINSVNPVFRLSEINRIEQQFIALQEEAVRIERLYDEPRDSLTKEEQGDLSEDQIAVALGGFVLLDKKQALILSERTFTLLEHLERRICDKRSRVYFYRMAAVGFFAIVISVVSLILSL